MSSTDQPDIKTRDRKILEQMKLVVDTVNDPIDALACIVNLLESAVGLVASSKKV